MKEEKYYEAANLMDEISYLRTNIETLKSEKVKVSLSGASLSFPCGQMDEWNTIVQKYLIRKFSEKLVALERRMEKL